MSDPKTPIVASNVYIRPLAAEGGDPADWVNLGAVSAIEWGVGNWYETDEAAPSDAPRVRSGFPGDERCGAMAVKERVWDDGRRRRLVVPCLLAPDHGGDRHEGIAGPWLETGDPQGWVTVWPEVADATGIDDSVSGPPFSAVIDRSDYDPAWEPNEGAGE